MCIVTNPTIRPICEVKIHTHSQERLCTGNACKSEAYGFISASEHTSGVWRDHTLTPVESLLRALLVDLGGGEDGHTVPLDPDRHVGLV